MSNFRPQKNPENINASQRGYEILNKSELLDIYNSYQKIYQTAILIAISKDLPKWNFDEKLERNIADVSAIFHKNEFRIEYLLKLFGYDDSNYIIEGISLAEAGLRYLEEQINSGIDLMKLLTDSV